MRHAVLFQAAANNLFTIILFLRFGMLPYFPVNSCSDRGAMARLFGARCSSTGSHFLAHEGFCHATAVT